MTISNGSFEIQDPASSNPGVADDWAVSETYTAEEYAEFTVDATVPEATLGQEPFETEWPAGFLEGLVVFAGYFDDIEPAFFDFGGGGGGDPTSFEDCENLWGTGSQGLFDFESAIPVVARFDSAEATGDEEFEDFEEGWPAGAVFLEDLAVAGTIAASFTFAGPEAFETSWTGQPYTATFTPSDLTLALFGNGFASVTNKEAFEDVELDFAVVSIDPGTDTFTRISHGLADTWKITFSNAGGRLPSGLLSSVEYFVITATANTWQVSATSGGAAVDLTDVGYGTHTVKHDRDFFWTEELAV